MIDGEERWQNLENESNLVRARPSSSNDVSSLYPAYTAVRCSANLIARSTSPSTPLDAYRVHSPFPVYLSLLESNGPRCYPADRRSSCATDASSIISPTPPRSSLESLTGFTVIGGLLMILVILISRRHRRENEDRQRLTVAVVVDEPPPAQPLNEKIEGDFRWWLEREHDDGYQQLSEACRRAVNHRLSQACVSHSLSLSLSLFSVNETSVTLTSSGQNCLCSATLLPDVP